MQSRFEDKLRFVILDWNSKEGKEAAAQAGLKKPPVSVMVNPRGEVTDKFEGSISNKEITKKLNALIRTSVSD